MIEQVTLENFKIFKENTTVTLGKITLLTGPNGSGKSSVIQSFLLFRQSAEHDLYGHQLILKGSCVDLGNFGDIANVQRSNQPIRFQFKFTSSQPDNSLNFEAEYLFDRKEEISTYWLQELDIRSFNNQRLQSEKFIGENIGPLIGWLPKSLKTSLSESLNDHLDFRKIHFISAYRRGPENFIPKTNLPFFPNTGPKGEFSENILAEHRSDLVHERLYRGNNARTLEQQTVEWLDYIFGGARLEIKGTDSDSSVLGLLMNTQNNDYRFKPTNIGFGYYYVLPIVISGLIAMPESLLIVENPEAHLHPAAQSRLAKFLTQVTLTGVQVIIESHSEHILNALRIGVGNEVFPLTAQDVKVLYFSEAKNATFVEIEIDESGKIADWPVGFFDQTDNDFKILYG